MRQIATVGQRTQLDAADLDAGTAAHQETFALLATVLTPTVARTLRGPKVDTAWSSRNRQVPDEPEGWEAVAAACGVALTWAPDFTGLPR